MTSLRRRLTLGVVVSLSPIVVALSAVIYVVVGHHLRRQVDDALIATANAFASVVERDPDEPSGYELEFDAALAPEFSDPRGFAYFEIWLPDGTVRGKSDALGDRDLPRLSGSMAQPAIESIELSGGRPGRIVYYDFKPRVDVDHQDKVFSEHVSLAVARDVSDLERTLFALAAWLSGLCALCVVLAGGAVLVNVRRGLRPLGRLADEIERLDDTRLDERLDVRHYPSEVSVPITRLNDLLGRLDEAFARERRITADLGHELRTPLAALRSVLEVAASKPRVPAEYEAAIADALAITKDMVATAETLLLLSRAEAGQVDTVREPVDLHALVEESWVPYAATSRARALSFSNRVRPGHRIVTDREKLRLVLGNLLSNAAAYTEEGGWIEVAVPCAETGVVEVTDSGPPIDATALAHLFDRFWRGDQARTKAGTHAGIGLSLVRALCRSLEYTVDVVNTPQGHVRFTVAQAATGEPNAEAGEAFEVG
ncbi:MAG: ATP-binding protein [Nannocystaceae bacterium]|nr:ATP-binding protein [bacterium]